MLRHFLLVLLCLLGASVLAESQCGAQCRFRFCDPDGQGNPTVPLPPGPDTVLRAARIASYPPVCLPGKNVKVLNTSEAAISTKRNRDAVPISHFRSDELDLPANFFGLFRIRLSDNLRSVARRKSLGELENTLDGTCVVLPIATYVVRRKRRKGRTRKIVRTGRRRDCVSFVPRTPELVFDVFWNGIDDLTVEIIGPGGVRGTLVKTSTRRGGAAVVIFPVALEGEYNVAADVTVREEFVGPGPRPSDPPRAAVERMALQGGSTTARWRTRFLELLRPGTEADGGGEWDGGGYASGGVTEFYQDAWTGKATARNLESDRKGYVNMVVSTKGRKVQDKRRRYKRSTTGAKIDFDLKFNL